MENVKGVIGDKITYAKNQYDALNGADALLIVTEWPVFRAPDFEQMKSILKNNVIFDGRNLYKNSEMKKNGFEYHSIGREEVKNE